MADNVFQYPGMRMATEPEEEHDESSTIMFGFWFFLMSDAVLFALVFSTYLFSRHATSGGPGPRTLYDMGSVFAQTLLLLASSFTFGLASLALKYKHSLTRLLGWMLVTLVLGAGFLALELHDFFSMVALGGAAQNSGFLSSFWDLVPLHGLHVFVGCVWMVCIIAQIWRYGLDHWSRLGIQRLALFWHFLDIVWIGIFTIVYIAGVA
ncbi:MAG TPA: cytochrome c oxidase subunit 3 [Burkholderiaceae bacterium]|nr:cytochrome c oxidase subunit 3 [Burkholderiaceae bacterium]